jgi:hypothetical protein
MPTIRLKRSLGALAPTSLVYGEIAVTLQQATQGTYLNKAGRLFVGNAAQNPVEVGGEYYTELLNHQPGQINSNSAVITGAAGTVNHWSVVGVSTFGDLQINGDTTVTGLFDFQNAVTYSRLTGSDLSNSATVSFTGINTFTRLYIDEDLRVSGVTTFTGISTFGSQVSVAGSVSIGGSTGYILNDGYAKVDSLVLSGLSTNGIVLTQPDTAGELGKPRLTVSPSIQFIPGSPNLLVLDGNLSVGGTITVPTGIVTTISGTTLTYTTGNIETANLGVGTNAYRMPLADGTNGQIMMTDGAGSIEFVDNDERLAFIGDSGNGSVGLRSETFNILGTANEVDTIAVGNTITIGLPDEVIVGTSLTVTGPVSIAGSLTVQGGITYLDSTITQIQDKKIDLAYTDSPNDSTADGGGISIKGTSDYEITWGQGVGAFQVNQSWLPFSNNTYDLGSDSVQWRNLYVDGGADLDDLNVAGVGTIAFSDINDGNIDGTVIGAAVSTTGYFEELGFGATAHGSQLTLLSGTITSLQVTGITTLSTLFSSTVPGLNGVGYAGTNGEIGFTSAPSAGISTSTYVLTSLGDGVDDVPVWTDVIDCGSY